MRQESEKPTAIIRAWLFKQPKEREFTFKEVADETPLDAKQVRYVLANLANHGELFRSGSKANRGTIPLILYRREVVKKASKPKNIRRTADEQVLAHQGKIMDEIGQALDWMTRRRLGQLGQTICP